MAPPPNIIFVLVDQLGAPWLPLHGHPLVATPHLDQFAQGSAVFERAITSSPVCTPYRGCLLSGLYPSQTGVTRNGQAFPSDIKSLADCFNDGGYSTHYIGKWHLSGAPQKNRWVPPQQRAGFQHFTGWESHHVDHNAGLCWRDDPHEAIPMAGHETDALTELAIDELEALAGPEQPFFLMLSYQAPHPPCSPPREFADLYADRDLLLESNADPAAWFKHEAWKADYGIERFRQLYFGEISQLDAAFGRLLAALEQFGLKDDALIVFTSDHGEMAGAHGLFGKGVMYEESLHVPLIINAPGQTQGSRIKTPAATIDLMPTLLDYAGYEGMPPGEGQSLRPYMQGQASEPERIVISEFDSFCATNADWKLATAGRTLSPAGLYHIAEDPHEMNNLVDEPACAQVQAELSQALAQWQARVMPECDIPTKQRESESLWPAPLI